MAIRRSLGNITPGIPLDPLQEQVLGEFALQHKTPHIVPGLYTIQLPGHSHVYEFNLTCDLLRRPSTSRKGEYCYEAFNSNQHIGEGAFGKVYQIIGTFVPRRDGSLSYSSDIDRAVKIEIQAIEVPLQQNDPVKLAKAIAAIENDKQARLDKIKLENQLQYSAPHLRAKEIVIEENSSYQVMRKLSGKTVHEYKKPLHFDTCIDFAIELLLKAEQQLQANNIVHCDIKSDNVMIDELGNITFFDYSEGAVLDTPKHKFDASLKVLCKHLPQEIFGSGVILATPSLDAYSLSRTICRKLGVKDAEFEKLGETLQRLCNRDSQGQVVAPNHQTLFINVLTLLMLPDPINRMTTSRALSFLEDIRLERKLATFLSANKCKQLWETNASARATRGELFNKFENASPTPITLSNINNLTHFIKTKLASIPDDADNITEFVSVLGLHCIAGFTRKEAIIAELERQTVLLMIARKKEKLQASLSTLQDVMLSITPGDPLFAESLQAARYAQEDAQRYLEKSHQSNLQFDHLIEKRKRIERMTLTHCDKLDKIHANLLTILDEKVSASLKKIDRMVIELSYIEAGYVASDDAGRKNVATQAHELIRAIKHIKGECALNTDPCIAFYQVERMQTQLAPCMEQATQLVSELKRQALHSLRATEITFTKMADTLFSIHQNLTALRDPDFNDTRDQLTLLTQQLRDTSTLLTEKSKAFSILILEEADGCPTILRACTAQYKQQIKTITEQLKMRTFAMRDRVMLMKLSLESCQAFDRTRQEIRERELIHSAKSLQGILEEQFTPEYVSNLSCIELLEANRLLQEKFNKLSMNVERMKTFASPFSDRQAGLWEINEKGFNFNSIPEALAKIDKDYDPTSSDVNRLRHFLKCGIERYLHASTTEYKLFGVRFTFSRATSKHRIRDMEDLLAIIHTPDMTAQRMIEHIRHRCTQCLRGGFGRSELADSMENVLAQYQEYTVASRRALARNK